MTSERDGELTLHQSDICRLVTESPWHCWTNNRHLNPHFVPEHSEAMDIGSIVHALLLEGSDAKVHLIQATKTEGSGKNKVDTGIPVDDWKTTRAREERDKARAEGKFPILQSDYPAVQAMVASAKIQLAAFREHKDAFTGGQSEVTLKWLEDGVAASGRLDYLMGDKRRIYDYKTTGGTANPDRLSRQIFDMGYDIQGVWYTRGVRAVYDTEAEFYLVTQETYPPYALSIVGLDPSAKWYGERRVDLGLKLWKECTAKNEWPGYPAQTCWAELPKYLEEAQLRKETA